MWISKRKIKELEKRVADLEKRLQSQQKEILKTMDLFTKMGITFH